MNVQAANGKGQRGRFRVARIVAPLFYGWAFDSLGVASPYYFSSAIIAATIFLGFGLDKYERADALAQSAVSPQSASSERAAMAATAGAEPEA